MFPAFSALHSLTPSARSPELQANQPHSPPQPGYPSYAPYAPYPHAHAYPHYPQPMYPQYPYASRQQQSPAPTQGMELIAILLLLSLRVLGVGYLVGAA